MECVLRKFGSYENFEEVTGGSVLPKSQVWAAVRKYLQKEGCVGEVSVVRKEDTSYCNASSSSVQVKRSSYVNV